MDANDWKKFVYKTINFNVETPVECGANCNYFNENCDLFILQSDTTVCHIGTFENGQQNYLSSPGGDHPVHLNIGSTNHNSHFEPKSCKKILPILGKNCDIFEQFR